MTDTSTTSTNVEKPLGLDVRNPDNPYLRDVGVIGSAETTSTGNTVLRVGQMLPDGVAWEQKVMVVLTPEERQALINVLTVHTDWWAASA